MRLKANLILIILSLTAAAASGPGYGQHDPGAAEAPPLPDTGAVWLEVGPTIEGLLADEDTDGDLKITVSDTASGEGERGDAEFILHTADDERYMLEGTWSLSVLLQELALLSELGVHRAKISAETLYESPVTRIARLIRERYWANLTRRVDVQHLEEVLPDDKVGSGDSWYLYVPAADERAVDYFAGADGMRIGSKDVEVRILPPPGEMPPEFVLSLRGRHGLLTLALRGGRGGIRGAPYVVPGGRFNEMYGWDSYFITLGLLAEGRDRTGRALAMAMMKNFVYEIEHYGRILNGNRTYYLTRSQPPFLTSMMIAYGDAAKEDLGRLDPDTLGEWILAAIREYRGVWTSGPRITRTGLSRYYGEGIGKPPEVEPGHFRKVYEPFARERGISVEEFEALYSEREIDVPELDLFHTHDRAMRESGHDRSYRWFVPGDRIAERDRCADFVTVDLNCLLYKYELDIARLIEERFGGRLPAGGGEYEESAVWRNRAAARGDSIRKYLWNGRLGMFTDYNLELDEHWPYLTAAVFYPLWACDPEDTSSFLVESAACSTMVFAALGALEEAGGLAASSKESLEAARDLPGEDRQWDYPYGWAPHQMIAWRGLLNHGFEIEAHRLIYRWLHMIASNARDYNGTVPEKFDVVKRSHRVFAEYGNVGTEFEYITKEGFGWMNASFVVGLELLPDSLRGSLEDMVPPEDVFGSPE